MNYIDYLILFLFSGIISIDRNNALNIMISRPFIISIFFYLIFYSNPVILVMGIIFEIYGLTDVPVGTHISKDDTFAAYASCLTSLHSNIDTSIKFIALILFTIILMYFVTNFDLYSKKINRILYNRAESKDNFRPKKLIFIGILVAFFKGVIIYNLGALLLIGIINNITIVSDRNIGIYACILITVVMAYFMDFFEIFGHKKYFFILLGFLCGWFVL